MRRIILLISLVLLVVFAFSFGAGSSPTRAQSPTPAATLTNAEVESKIDLLLGVADKAINTASTVAGFIQSISVVFAGFAAIGGFILSIGVFATLRGYRTQLDAMRNQLASEAQAAEKRRVQVEQEIEAQLQTVRAQAMDAIGQAKTAAERTGRALTLIQLGEGQFESGNINAAIRAYEDAAKLDPQNRAANYQLGELYLLKGNLEKAVSYLELTLREDANFAPAVAALGLAMRKQGDSMTDLGDRNQMYAKAEQKLLDSLRLDPNVRDANKQSVNGALAALYKRQGRIKDAIHFYALAENTTPESSYPIGNLAQLYFLQGDSENARSYFSRSMANSQQVVAGRPGDFWARFDLATATVAMDDPNWKRELSAALAHAPTGALDSLYSGLLNLRNAPRPPASIDSALAMLNAEVEARKAAEAG